MIIVTVGENLLEMVCLLSKVYKYVGGNEFMYIMKKYFERKIVSFLVPKPSVTGDKMYVELSIIVFLWDHIFIYNS